MKPPPLPNSSTNLKYWVLVALACVMAPLVPIYLIGVRAYINPTGSMEDTLIVGDRIFVEKITNYLGWRPQRGDVVVFEYPVDRRQIYIKRVVGLPGDRLRMVNKRMYRNGAAVAEPYACHKTDYIDDYRDNFPGPASPQALEPGLRMLEENVRAGEVVVPPGKYFVMGDNRDLSLDSRYFGFISKDDIIGRPLMIYASPKAERIFKPLGRR